MNQQDSKFMSAREGAITINDTDLKDDVQFYGFEVAKGSVISVLKDKDGEDVLSIYISTPATAFKKDSLIVAMGDNYFTQIKMSTAGQVDLIIRDQP